MSVRKFVRVTVELAGGVRTVEDVKERLDVLPDTWELESFGVPKVEVVIKVPRGVSEDDVNKHVTDSMAALDAARAEAEDLRNEKEDSAHAVEKIGVGLRNQCRPTK